MDIGGSILPVSTFIFITSRVILSVSVGFILSTKDVKPYLCGI
ncbi:hypothetical protein BACEGG_02151 [Bacteroides eggerthii DSM 20697]|nr:hypothetical protein BACEGG_02151 [Bacteroides eggerthii DSM 20697]